MQFTCLPTDKLVYNFLVTGYHMTMRQSCGVTWRIFQSCHMAYR